PVPPTPTPTPSTNITFLADPLTVNEGQCTTFSWLVTGVKAVYFNDEGVAGDDNGQPVTREECPTQTTTYTLRVVQQNDEEIVKKITIKVNVKPEAPSDLAVDERMQDGFRLTWTDNSTVEKGFRLYNADTRELLKTFGKDAEGGTISGLACGVTVRLYLVAFNDVGESPPSNTVSEATLGCS
ncbi:MAG: fibronectin type III domain-containing protein, partial [Caldilineae bacterium]